MGSDTFHILLNVICKFKSLSASYGLGFPVKVTKINWSVTSLCNCVETCFPVVGLNRNIALMHATAEICLLADDDMTYSKGYEQKIIDEFEKNPNADVIIFNIGTSTPEYGRMPTQIYKFKRFHRWNRNPYGAPRIAFRLAEVQKRGAFFSQYFGGGTMFPSGEDTIWLDTLMKAGLKVYLSPVMIGNVSYETSSWFSDDVRKLCYGRGALLKARKNGCALLWTIYYATIRKPKELSIFETIKWIECGKKGFLVNRSYENFIGEQKNE